MKRILILSAGIFALVVNLQAGFSDRKNQAVADSGKPVAVKGATPITVASDYGAAFDAVVKILQKADDPVVLADRDAGMVATEIEITGKWKQTGTRMVVTFIKESEKETTVKVAVTTQSRYKALQVEPWGDPKLDPAKTAEAVAKLRTSLGVK